VDVQLLREDLRVVNVVRKGGEERHVVGEGDRTQRPPPWELRLLGEVGSRVGSGRRGATVAREKDRAVVLPGLPEDLTGLGYLIGVDLRDRPRQLLLVPADGVLEGVGGWVMA
jgi:hypothetical protein